MKKAILIFITICVLAAAVLIPVGAVSDTRTIQLNLTNLNTTSKVAEGWTWNATTKTLTLNDVQFTYNGEGGAIVIPAGSTIRASGTNNITGAYGIRCSGSLTLICEAGGTLNVKTVFSDGTLTLNGVSGQMRYLSATSASGGVTVTESAVTFSGENAGIISAGNITINSGSDLVITNSSYDDCLRAGKTLKIENSTVTASITSTASEDHCITGKSVSIIGSIVNAGSKGTGGCIYVGEGETLSIQNSTVECSNSRTGIAVDSGSGTVTGSDLVMNNCRTGVDIYQSAFSANSTSFHITGSAGNAVDACGSQVYNSSTWTHQYEYCTFSGCTFDISGGNGIYTWISRFTDCTISAQNVITGIWAQHATFEDCDFNVSAVKKNGSEYSSPAFHGCALVAVAGTNINPAGKYVAYQEGVTLVNPSGTLLGEAAAMYGEGIFVNQKNHSATNEAKAAITVTGTYVSGGAELKTISHFTSGYLGYDWQAGQGLISAKATAAVSSGKSPKFSQSDLLPTNVAKKVIFSSLFADVAPGAWYYNAVEYAINNKLFSGTSTTHFSPDSSMTRGMLVTVLYSMEGRPELTGENIFADVSETAWYRNAVVWANTSGLVAGTDATHFSPDLPITRQQMALILFKYAQLKNYDTTARADLSHYKDSGKVAAWAREAMEWAVGEGLISGMSATELNPAGNATRAQVAVILRNFCEKTALTTAPEPVEPTEPVDGEETGEDTPATPDEPEPTDGTEDPDEGTDPETTDDPETTGEDGTGEDTSPDPETAGEADGS